MSETSPTSSTQNICIGCGRDIYSNYYYVEGKIYCADCFRKWKIDYLIGEYLYKKQEAQRLCDLERRIGKGE